MFFLHHQKHHFIGPPPSYSYAMNKAVFLDRDGVINVDHGYVCKPEDFEFLDGIFPILSELAEKSYLLIIVTNQSGIGRGYYTEEDFQKLTAWMMERFREEKVDITAVYHCPHAPKEKCSCRKPAPGMFLEAIHELGINPDCSWMVGDKPSDMEAAAAAGVKNRVMIGGADSAHSTHQIAELDELLGLIK